MSSLNESEIEFLEAALANKNVNVASDGELIYPKSQRVPKSEFLYKIFSWIFFILSLVPIAISGFLLAIYFRLKIQIGGDTIQWVESSAISQYIELIDPGSKEGAALDMVIEFYNNLPYIIGIIGFIAALFLICGIFAVALYESKRSKRLAMGSEIDNEEKS